MTQIPKLDLKSKNLTEEQKAKLKQLFPEIFTEGGKIDFDKLKLTLGEEVDTGDERFGLTWPGKRDCFKVIQEPSIATLRPCPEESVNWETTENLFIEGDNLEVLKQLQKSYYGKVKMIYIDPPYNTGKEFIYPDKYAESLETYLAYTGQVDAAGRKFSTNTDTDGRFHSKWLNMMYPRLFLARNLLRKDGVIAISIDDNECQKLQLVMSELFGEGNFLAQLVWKKKYIGGKHAKHFVDLHEYVLFYAKDASSLEEVLMERPAGEKSKFKLVDDFIQSRGRHYIRPLKSNLGKRKTLIYPISLPDGTVIETQWMVSKKTFKDLVKDGRVVFKRKQDGKYQIYRKFYEKDGDGMVKVPSLIDDVSNANGKLEIKELFEISEGREIPFENPKPTGLLNHLTRPILGSEDIVLDFFSGSCTTAHAVFDLNQKDGGNRKFIMVQLPEPCDEKSEAHKAGYKTIADIGKERIRRVIKKIQAQQAEQQKAAASDLFDNPPSTESPFEGGQLREASSEQSRGMSNAATQLDLGFKVFKLAPSNFKIWDGAVADHAIEKQLEMAIDHIDPQSTEQDILYEILLKSGFELTTPIMELTLAGKKVYSVAEGALLICLEKELTPEVIRTIAEKEPQRVVCLDSGFAGNDQLKTNAVQIMKSFDVENFKTV